MKCPVCGIDNGEFATTCSSCKSYLQSKVDALDLFGTLWRLLESPREAFRRIVLSQHKNYVFLLSALLGVSLVYGLFWFKNLANFFSNILTLLGAGLLLGPPVGIALAALSSLILTGLLRVFRKRVSVRNMFTVVSYAAAPVVFSLIAVFPVEVAVFGSDLFRSDPSPMAIKPVVYSILLLLDGLAVVWSWVLLTRGVSVAGGLSIPKALFVTFGFLVIAGAAAIGVRSL